MEVDMVVLNSIFNQTPTYIQRVRETVDLLVQDGHL